MKTKKLTAIPVYKYCGEVRDTIFAFVDYIDGELDLVDVRRVVALMPGHWMFWSGFTGGTPLMPTIQIPFKFRTSA